MPVLPAAPLSPLRKGGKPLQLHRAEPYSTCCVQRACQQAGAPPAWQKIKNGISGPPSFAGLDKELASASLSRVLQRSAAGTLRKHFPGWRLWKSFASDHGWEGGSFSQSQLVLFLQALAEAGHAPAAASSLRFVASILGHRCWIEQFADPVVKAWCSSKAKKLVKKEA